LENEGAVEEDGEIQGVCRYRTLDGIQCPQERHELLGALTDCQVRNGQVVQHTGIARCEAMRLLQRCHRGVECGGGGVNEPKIDERNSPERRQRVMRWGGAGIPLRIDDALRAAGARLERGAAAYLGHQRGRIHWHTPLPGCLAGKPAGSEALCQEEIDKALLR
jgi:hypothetical protein